MEKEAVCANVMGFIEESIVLLQNRYGASEQRIKISMPKYFHDYFSEWLKGLYPMVYEDMLDITQIAGCKVRINTSRVVCVWIPGRDQDYTMEVI